MANTWFRFYSEFATDPKVQSMSEAMQRRLAMLFCLCNDETLHALHVTEIAVALRISDEELAETKALFLIKKFIDEEWNIINWDKRQFKSDSSAERVRKHRKKKNEEKEKRCNAKETKCNVTVTPPDTDTELRKKKDIIKENNIPKKSARSPEKEIFVLPERIPKTPWDDFMESRKMRGKYPTIKAKRLLADKLLNLEKLGHDPTQVLEQSVMSGWTGLFEIKQNQGKTHENFSGNSYIDNSDGSIGNGTTGRLAKCGTKARTTSEIWRDAWAGTVE